MPKLRLHLVTPYLDGDYYGRFFAALQEEAAKREAAIFTIQTFTIDEHPTPFAYQAGSEAADGIFMIPHFVRPLSSDYLTQLASFGKPIVTLGFVQPLIASHAVVADHMKAAKEAVLHLIHHHGHRRIAFVGNIKQPDIAQRYEGYREALAESGIPFDPALLYIASDQMTMGGRQAARAMMADGGLSFTAVLAGTDLVGIGMMESFREAGIRVPDDVAIAAYDDISAAATTSPPLTTIRQSFESIAKAGFDLMMRLIQGNSILPGKTYVDANLIVRQSCGCPAPSREAHDPSYAEIKGQLEQSRQAIEKLTMRQYQLSGTWTASTIRSEAVHFSNMYWKDAYWGCLALWDEHDPERKHLIIHQVFGRDGDPSPAVGLRVPIERFPENVWLPDLGQNDYIRVQSIRSSRKDWGFIALAVPMDELVLIPSSDIMMHSSTFFAAVLENGQLTRQIRHLAFHDSLTGLPNRKWLHDFLSDCIVDANRSKHQIGLLWIDLDRFKAVNDTLGHEAGDELLRQVAAMLDRTIRDFAEKHPPITGYVARIGGDEFIALLCEVGSVDEVKLAAHRILDRFMIPFRLLDHELLASSSIGISIYPHDGSDIDSLMRNADRAMYQVKNSGKNNVEAYSSELTDSQGNTQL